MFQVPDYNLWLGNGGDVRNPRQVLDKGIVALVELGAEEPIVAMPRDLIYCRFPLVDGPGNAPDLLRLSIQTIISLLRANVPTLVYCNAGISRGPAIAAAALALVSQKTPEETLRGLADLHALDVTPAFWHEVKIAAELMA